MDNIELLRAKDAIFKMIVQFHHCSQREDDSYYVSDYYESALERCFQVLGFKDDEVPLMVFCQAWEENNRKIWSSCGPDREYRGLKAEDYYDIFVKDYNRWLKFMSEDIEESC